MDKKQQLAWLLERQLAWIAAADMKLLILVPVPLALLGVLFSLAQPSELGLSPHTAPFWITSVLLVLSLGFAFACVVPRVNGAPKSNIFFGEIAPQSEEKYLDALSGENAIEDDDIARQILINSKIAEAKYKNSVRATFSLIFAIAPFLFSVLNFG